MHDVKLRTDARYIELDTDRPIRYRNKLYYRILHWPIWVFVFFIAPGPLTFEFIERGFRPDPPIAAWLSVVLIGTAVAGLRGRLPGCEPKPYIIRFTEDRPNPLYRRVCYTTAWGEVVAFAVLNAAGLAYAAAFGEWRLKEMYAVGVLSDRGYVMGGWHRRSVASSKAVHEGRRARATLFLWLRVGRGHRTTRPVGVVEGVAGGPCRGRCQVDSVRRDSCRRRQAVPPRSTSPHEADCAGTVGHQ